MEGALLSFLGRQDYFKIWIPGFRVLTKLAYLISREPLSEPLDPSQPFLLSLAELKEAS